jgi:hypothetical protein
LNAYFAVHAFMVEQDAASASARLAQLKRDLREMKTVLAWSPACGRPARFLKPNSAQASLRFAAVQQFAESAGLPHQREFVMGSHVVLYAHSDTEVVLLCRSVGGSSGAALPLGLTGFFDDFDLSCGSTLKHMSIGPLFFSRRRSADELRK